MKYNCSISGHLIKIKEHVSGVKEAMLDCDYDQVPTTIENVKNAYLKRYGKELEGDSWGRWLAVPFRGQKWTFLNEVQFHRSCNYISFRFGADEHPLHGRCYLKHAFI